MATSLSKVSNFVRTTLTVAVTTSDLTITLNSAGGLPSITGSEYFVVSVVDLETVSREIMKVTEVTGKVCTVTRAQEDTTALAFGIGDRVELVLTAGCLDTRYSELDTRITTAQGDADSAETVATAAGNTASSAYVQSSTAITNAATAQTQADTALNDAFIADGKAGLNTFKLSTLGAVGMIAPFATPTVPIGWLACNGQLIDKGGQYLALYTYLKDGTSYCLYGEEDTQFYLPDYRGQFLRGWNNSQPTDALADPDALNRSSRGHDGAGGILPAGGDVVGSKQAFATDTYNPTSEDDDIPSINLNNSYSTEGIVKKDFKDGSVEFNQIETRPKNTYVQYCIFYQLNW